MTRCSDRIIRHATLPDCREFHRRATAAIPGGAKQRAFTLLEVSVVLVILTLLLGALLVPLGGAFEENRRKRTRLQLDEITDALTGFAAARQRLPCPATGRSNGREMPHGGGDCAVAHGFVPAVTLALQGELNADGLLLDVWGNPLRYSVDQSSKVGGAASADFTTAGDMAATGISRLAPRLVICTRASSRISCGSGGAIRANQVPAIIFSMGRDWSDYTGADQLANAGEADGMATLSGSTRAYPIAADPIFVSKSYTATEGNEKFDDIVVWLSANLLYARLIQAGVLP